MNNKRNKDRRGTVGRTGGWEKPVFEELQFGESGTN